MAAPLELPVAGVAPSERCDALRNRRRIVAAAEELFSRHGVDRVSLDQVAAHAGVGKGTIFRRFGDRGGLLRAVLNDSEAAFQEELIRGPAPLGPGAAARERLLAFGPALLALIELHGELIRAAESGRGTRTNSAVYAVYRTHLRVLLTEADPSLDADYAADALLAPLSADLCLAQLQGGGMGLDRIAAGWQSLAGRLVPPV